MENTWRLSLCIQWANTVLKFFWWIPRPLNSCAVRGLFSFTRRVLTSCAMQQEFICASKKIVIHSSRHLHLTLQYIISSSMTAYWNTMELAGDHLPGMICSGASSGAKVICADCCHAPKGRGYIHLQNSDLSVAVFMWLHNVEIA